MNTKAIKGVLGGHHARWIKTIKDEEVAKLASENTFISGGAVASLLTGVEINDIDIYFKNKETAYAVASYYVKEWNADARHTKEAEIDEEEYKYSGKVEVFIRSSGVLKEDDETGEMATSGTEPRPAENIDATTGHRAVYLTDNAISLSGGVQLVLRFVGSVEEVQSNFDYVHCTCSYEPHSRTLTTPEEALLSLMSKELIYCGSKYPLCSLFRMRKFISRGYFINAGQILKMVFQLQDLNLKNKEVLREQLIGVDTTYMMAFIRAMETDDGEAVSTTYLLELVDEVFSDDYNVKKGEKMK